MSMPAWKRFPRGPKGSPTGPCQRKREADRRARQRPAQRGVRGRPGHSVRSEPGPVLEAPQRSVRARAEVAVERPGGKAVPGERELERGDVPAARAEGELPAPEGRRVARSGPLPCESAPRARRRRPGLRVAGSVAAPARSRDRAHRRPSPGTTRAPASRPEARRRRGCRPQRRCSQSPAPKGTARKPLPFGPPSWDENRQVSSWSHPPKGGLRSRDQIPNSGDARAPNRPDTAFRRPVRQRREVLRRIREMQATPDGAAFPLGRMLCAGLLVATAIYAIETLVVPQGRLDTLFDSLVYNGLLVAASLVCLAPGSSSCAPSGSRGSSSGRPSRSGRPATSTTTSS